MMMKIKGRTWPVLLAATFVTAVWVTAAPAAEVSTTTAVHPAKTAKAKPAAAHVRHAKRVAKRPQPRPVPFRLASRYFSPAFSRYFPLYLGIAY
jgi:hypothetical protein